MGDFQGFEYDNILYGAEWTNGRTKRPSKEQRHNERQQKEDDLSAASEEMKLLEDDAHEKMNKLWEKHRLKVAVLKLSFLLPVFLVVSFFFMKFHGGAYWPLVWSAFIASFLTQDNKQSN